MPYGLESFNRLTLKLTQKNVNANLSVREQAINGEL